MNSLFTIALMFKVLDNATAPVGRINSTLDTTGKVLDRAAGKSAGLNTGLAAGAAAAGKVASGVDRIGRAAQNATDKLTALQKRTEKLGESAQKLEGLGRPMAATGAIGALGIEKALEQFGNLEMAQKNLRTNLMDQTGKVGPEFEKLNALAEKLGTDLPGSTRDMLDMFTALREQGVQTNIILGGMGEAAAKFAVIMKVPFAQAATHVAKFSEALGIADRDAVPFMDILQRLKGAGGVNVTDLAESFKYSGASLKALRIQGLAAGQDVSAAIGMMATSSIEGSQAGTNFAMALSRMAEISHRLESKKIKELVGPILDAKGIKLNFFDHGGNFVGIRGMIAEMEKLRAINPQEQLVVLSKLFGQEASRPLSVFISQGVAGFDEMNRRMKAQADMQTKIGEIMASNKMQWETMTGTAENMVAHVGGVLSKLINLPGILGKVNDLFGRIDSWVLLHPKTAGVLAGIAVTLTILGVAGGGVLLAIAGMGKLLPAAIDGMATLGKAASWTTGRLLAMKGASVARGPFGEIINVAPAAGSKLSALGSLFSGGFVTGIKSAMVAVRAFGVTLLTTPVGWIALAIGVAALLIYKYWGPISGFFRGLWSGLKSGLKGLEPAWNEFKKYALVIRPFFEPLFALGRLIKALIGPVNDTGKAAENMGVRFGKAIAKILVSVLTLPGKMLAAGMNIITSLTDGMLKMINKPVQVIDKLAKRIRGFLPFSPAKEGALRDINRIRLVETIAESIKPQPMVQAMKMATAATMIAAMPVGASMTPPAGHQVQLVQPVNQVLQRAAIPSVGNQVQLIHQAVKAAEIAPPAALVQPVNQVLQRAAIPAVGNQVQLIQQAVKRAQLPQLADATQQINQVPAPTPQRPAVASLARPISAGQGSGGITIHFAPQITVQGGGDPAAVKGAVMEASRTSQAELERMIDRIMAQKQRTKF